MTAPPTTDPLENTLRVFLGLLDLSRDVERNEDDARFRAEGGDLSYVFDADIFEIFVRPRDPRGRAASLHARAWTLDSLDAVTSRRWGMIAAQTAVSATEYLVSGALPGQRTPQIFMTLEHRWELARRTSEVAAECAAVLARSSLERSLARFGQVTDIRETMNAQNGDWQRIKDIDPILHADLEALRAEQLPKKALLQFAAFRAALSALAEDQVIEPAEQVQRILGPDLRHRFTTLHQEFPIAPEFEAQVVSDARRWFGLLMQEAKLQGVVIADPGPKANSDPRRKKQYEGRKRAALWDDARSLATIRWVASRHMGGKCRLAFVTADDLMFDTYRRWYAGLDPSSSAYSEPFLLRRLAQFAPMLNFTDARKFSGGKAREVFQDLKHLLEVNLLTLNLSRLNSRPVAEPILARMRELSALRRADPTRIADDPLYLGLAAALKRKWVAGELAGMQAVLDDLRWLERISLGQLDEHLQARLGEREATALGLMQPANENQMVRYVGNLIHKMLAASLKLWLPLAQEFIDAWRPRSGEMLIRAPVTARLQIADGANTIDVGEALSRKLAHVGDEGTPLLSRAAWRRAADDEALVFGIAAVLALASADWTSAQHFAEMAQKAFDSHKRGGGDRLSEYKYLTAIAQRFRIGQNGAPIEVDALARLARIYRAAEANINWSVSFHEAKTGRNAQPLRLLRSLSERAALRLFFCSALTPSVRRASARMRDGGRQSFQPISTDSCYELLGGDAEDIAAKSLTDAEVDLRRCLEIDSVSLADLSPDRGDALRTIRRQYLANICSAAVARRLLRASAGDEALSPSNADIVAKVRVFVTEHAITAHGVMRAEMLAYLCLSGDPNAGHQIQRIKKLPEDALALDRALLAAIQEAAQSSFS